MTHTALALLYTDIGRGHPFYLDGVVSEWARHGGDPAALELTDVFSVSGRMPRQLWKLMRTLYVRGSSPGPAAFLYRRIRGSKKLHHAGLATRLAGHTIRSRFGGASGPVLVAHPLLVSILAGQCDLYYQHGEVVTPDVAVVPGADVIFVPTAEAGAPFLAGGYPSERVVITGLCIEPDLVPAWKAAYARRRVRYEGNEPLTGAYFSSGAEPALHVAHLTDAARSAVRAGGQVVIFARQGGRLARQARRVMDLSTAAKLVTYASRAELDEVTARWFDRFDYLVAPAHERSNWALGLGLPMFSIGPDIGPYAPLNRACLAAAGVARSVVSRPDAEALGALLAELRHSGKLAEMAAAGYEAYPVNGFAKIAAFLSARCGGAVK